MVIAGFGKANPQGKLPISFLHHVRQEVVQLYMQV